MIKAEVGEKIDIFSYLWYLWNRERHRSSLCRKVAQMLRMMQLTSEKRFTPTRWHLDTGYFGILNQSAEQSPFAFATNPREERIF
jgi:hypothetical protein